MSIMPSKIRNLIIQYTKIIFKTVSYTENKPKYTKHIQDSESESESERRRLSNSQVKRRRLFAKERRPFNRAMGFLCLLKMQETCN